MTTGEVSTSTRVGCVLLCELQGVFTYMNATLRYSVSMLHGAPPATAASAIQ